MPDGIGPKFNGKSYTANGQWLDKLNINVVIVKKP